MTDAVPALNILVVAPEGEASARLIANLRNGPPPAEVVAVPTVAAARAALRRSPTDLVLAWPRLPDGDVAALLPGPSDAIAYPVVLLVNHAVTLEELNAILATGAFDYLVLEDAGFVDLPYRARRLAADWNAKADLRAKEAFNFALFQHSPAAMVIVAHDGTVIKSNLARRRMTLPLPPLGEPVFVPDRGDTEAGLAAGLQEAIRTGEVCQFADQTLCDRILNITMAPFPRGAVVIMEDVTERKRAEIESRQRQQQLIQADKMIALGSLVSGVAHEISNPNNVILLAGGVLKRTCDDIIRVLDHYRKLEGDFIVDRRPYDDIRAELPDMADTVLKAAERIRSLVDDLKTFARKGTEDLSETVRVNAAVEAAVRLLNPIVRKACHRLQLDLAAELPHITGNARHIEQVIVNLLSNACQSLPDPDRSIVIRTGLEPDGRTIRLEVRDEGRGIPPEQLARVTDPFFTTRQDSGGTGLGLSISRTIVENHQGELAFTSELGVGTVATVRLPVPTARTAPPAADIQPRKPRRP